MRLFISFSGDRSESIASAFAEWIRRTVQAVDPWFSTEIGKGKRWAPEIAEALRLSPMGLICVTPENVSNPWLLFEAGAISNTKDALVCTLLLGLKDTDVPLPLGQFQATMFDKIEVKKLVGAINDCVGKSGEKPLSAATLDKVFEDNWPGLEKAALDVTARPSPSSAPKRSVEDLLDEVLHTLRDIDRRTSLLGLQAGGVHDPSIAGSGFILGGPLSQLSGLPLESRAARLAQAVTNMGADTPLPLRVGTAGKRDVALPIQQPPSPGALEP